MAHIRARWFEGASYACPFQMWPESFENGHLRPVYYANMKSGGILRNEKKSFGK
jgi:hypothetical protein